MSDWFRRAVVRNDQVIVGVALTTETCQAAQTNQKLAATSTIALGRTISAAVLASLIQERPGALSVQVLANGRIKQTFADVTHEGHVRGYVRPGDLGMPPLAGETVTGRRAIAHALGSGVLSVIRVGRDQGFTQSTTDLVSGEIDSDVTHFMISSEQIPSFLVADVLLDDQDRVVRAGGLLAQAMPGANTARIEKIRERLSGGAFVDVLMDAEVSVATMLAHTVPDAEVIEPTLPIAWKCRCSLERVLASFRMLDPADFADLVNSQERVIVTCDFCGNVFHVEPRDVQQAYSATLKTQN